MKRLRLFDSMSRSEKELVPSDGKTFKMYCCGLTVYNFGHIGNFITFVRQDVLHRVLLTLGMPLLYVRGITDVDDKTIKRSIELGITLKELTDRYTKTFHEDCEKLNILPPNKEASAVDSIPEQIKMVEKLIENGHAYKTEDGSVYYNVGSLEQYGALSHLDKRELKLGSAQHKSTRVSDDEYEKEAAADFVLWKSYKPEDGDNVWDSPWGKGRPGWHIECSANCLKHLGETIDLHGGGEDLLFPHHENEIAQTEGCTCKTFCHHWTHSTHLLVDGQKMGKRFHNFYTVKDIAEKGYTPMELRYVLISGYYRQQLNFTLDSLNAARSALQKLAKFDDLIRSYASPGDSVREENLQKPSHVDIGFASFEKAWDALLSDLNTPQTLGDMFVAVNELESKLKKKEITPEQAEKEWLGFRKLLYALGLKLEKKKVETTESAPDEVKQIAEKRWQAKLSKDWAQADVFRVELEAKGWKSLDRKDGYDLVKN